MLPKNASSYTLPKEFKRYFWDVNFEELSFEKYPRFITERVLNFGDLHGIKWLLSNTDMQFISSVVNSSRNLNAKTRNYWQLILSQT